MHSPANSQLVTTPERSSTEPVPMMAAASTNGAENVLNFAASVPSAKRAAKRWKERRHQAALGGGVSCSSASSTVPLMVASSLMSPGSSFVLCDSQCVVEINAPSLNAEPVLAAQPVFKRRCSLTMPYPALYGSWQVQSASPAPPPKMVPVQQQPKVTTSSYDSPLMERKPAPPAIRNRTLQRRWSTFQMNVDQLLHIHHHPVAVPVTSSAVVPATSPASPPGLNPPSGQQRRRSGRQPSYDVSATITEQHEGEQSETSLSDPPVTDVSSAGPKVPKSLTLDRFNNGGQQQQLRGGSSSVQLDDISPSVVSSYLGDSSHQLSGETPYNSATNPSQFALTATTPATDTSAATGIDDDECDDEEELHLITCTLQRLPLKDFGAEVRPAVDITQFLQQSVLLLDVTENSPLDLVDLLLTKMVPSVAEEAKMILFTHDTGMIHVFSGPHRIQV